MTPAVRTYPLTTMRAVLYDEQHLPLYSEEAEVPDHPALFVQAVVPRWGQLLPTTLWPATWVVGSRT